MTHCIDCDRPVVWADVLATPEGAKVAMIAGSFGADALSERCQAIYHGRGEQAATNTPAEDDIPFQARQDN